MGTICDSGTRGATRHCKAMDFASGSRNKVRHWLATRIEEQESNQASEISNACSSNSTHRSQHPRGLSQLCPGKDACRHWTSTDQFDDGFRDCSKHRIALCHRPTRCLISFHRTRLTAYLAVRRLRTWHFAFLLFLGPF